MNVSVTKRFEQKYFQALGRMRDDRTVSPNLRGISWTFEEPDLYNDIIGDQYHEN